MADERPLIEGATFELVVVEDLKRTQLVQYAGVSGDFNPVHTDEVYACEVAGQPSVFAHGMLVMGMTGRLVTDCLGSEHLTSFGGRFTAQVWPGDTLTATAIVRSVEAVAGGQRRVVLEVVTRNQDDMTVFIGEASATR